MEAAVRWSQHSSGETERFLLVDVVDQSLTLNHVHQRSRKQVGYFPVARYGRLPNFGAFWWSQTDESLVALGLVSGSACLVKLREDDQPSETVATFKLKQQRKCNSIALSTDNWLAVALDKTRSDVCLNIFDANRGSQSPPDPVRRLCPAEVVSSVRFFPSQPQELIVAAQRSYVRLYDLRDGYFGGNSNLQTATRNVNNVAIDPLDEHYFASAGPTDEPNITVWDKRWISQASAGGNGSGAVFDFKPVVDNSSRTTVWSLRYSGQQRGRLGICSSRGELKVLDMFESPSSSLNDSDYAPLNPYGGTAWSCNRYVSQSRSVERPVEDTSDEIESMSRIIAFDWISTGKLAEQSVLALRPNRKLDVLRVPCTTPQASLTARGDLCMALEDICIAQTKARGEAVMPQAPYEQQRTAEDFGPLEYSGEAGHIDDGSAKVSCAADDVRVAAVLAPTTIQRERCRQGYLFDCEKNMNIVQGNWQLERLWEIINRFREHAENGGMIAESLDLSFVGVSGICSENIGNISRRTLSPSIGKLEDAVYALNSSRELPAFEGERTELPEHRQLCLEICGWKFTTANLEAECSELIERGLYYQAIVQAVLHGYKHTALNLLRSLIRSRTVPNIGLGALLASDNINEEQREMCLWMSADTEDPALKALLTFLTTGNWRDVMKTNYLHLGYRVALGLKYLNDTDLNGFIEGETARAVKNGDLEGILLTGLGEKAVDLLQTYVARTNDLQTAVLATAFTNPLYVDDVRWEFWKETYFMQMQSWRAFPERTRFVVEHCRMARTREGQTLIEPAPAQAVLQCNHCKRSLARRDGRSIVSSRPQQTGSTKGIPGPAASAGIVCPSCGRHMPRCSICRMWLGTPDPASRGGAKELQKLGDVMGKFLTFCVNCDHCFHADHARSWFTKHKACPVPDCRCICMVK
ncbi:WD repeat-containing mio [Lecanosticta acicola]|uniref:WD repeat-containing mio n=1 Tax=Lecanosticta acicola TaxID=111012 RepID=A0AAI8Z6U0_9PEZI|nr:WD repeat-containing mio [Lecanosticta acicola]